MYRRDLSTSDLPTTSKMALTPEQLAEKLKLLEEREKRVEKAFEEAEKIRTEALELQEAAIQAKKDEMEKAGLPAIFLEQMMNMNKNFERATSALVDKVEEIATPQNRIKVDKPMFSGKQKEDPELHVSLCTDWLRYENVYPADWGTYFRLTLTGEAKIWLDANAPHITEWEELTTMLKERFCKYGRSRRELLEQWRTLRFDPSSDSAELFIKKVKALAKSLGQTEESQVVAIKSCMPASASLSLHTINDLPTLSRMLIEGYPGPSTESSTPSGHFVFSPNQDQNPNKNGKKNKNPQNNQDTSLAEAINNLQLCLGQHQSRPFKPSQSRGRGRGRGRFRSRRNFRGNFRGRGRGRSQSRGRSNPDDQRCFKCWEFGHWKRECPNGQQNFNQQDRGRGGHRGRGGYRGRGGHRGGQSNYTNQNQYQNQGAPPHGQYNSASYSEYESEYETDGEYWEGEEHLN